MATCQNGHQNPNQRRFCGECGASLIENEKGDPGRLEAGSGAPSSRPKTLADKFVGERAEERAELHAKRDRGRGGAPTPEVGAPSPPPVGEQLGMFPAAPRVARAWNRLNPVRASAVGLGVVAVIVGALALAGVFGGGSSGPSQAEGQALQRHRREVFLAASTLSSLRVSWAGFVRNRAAAINQEGLDGYSNNLAAARVDFGHEGSAAGGLIAAIQAGFKVGSFPSSVEPDVSALFSAARGYQLAAQAARDNPSGLDFNARLAPVAAARTVLDNAYDGVVQHLKALATP
jgi:hypothetical protein